MLGNAVFAGHRNTFFRGLRDIQLNDEVRLVVVPHSYEYRVVSTQVVAPDELSVLDSRGTEELTLVTCYPFYYIGRAPSRFIVRAASCWRETGSWVSMSGLCSICAFVIATGSSLPIPSGWPMASGEIK